jgi:hypothetical protein
MAVNSKSAHVQYHLEVLTPSRLHRYTQRECVGEVRSDEDLKSQ